MAYTARDTAQATTDQIIKEQLEKALADVAAGTITSERFDEIMIALSDVFRLSR